MSQVVSNTVLFEVSWEVCNKVGGIYTVLSTKAKEAVYHFNDYYITIGPDLNNADFNEVYDSQWLDVISYLRSVGIHCRYGHWGISATPNTVLIDYRNSLDGYKQLYELLLKYNIDLTVENWSGIECAIFGLLAGRVIYEIYKNNFFDNKHFVGHFHEWMCGTGVIFLKDNENEVDTIFTTHATSVGRYLSKMNRNITKDIGAINSDFEAKKYKIQTKHLIEKVSANRCDMFTTISETTGREATHLLNRVPDCITNNGLCMDDLGCSLLNAKDRDLGKMNLIKDINQKLHWGLPSNTKIVFFSGRTEFKNKGLDVVVHALSLLEKEFEKAGTTVLFIGVILIQSNNTIYMTPPDIEGLRCERDLPIKDPTDGKYKMTKKFLFNTFKTHSLNNDGNIKYIFIPSFLDGNDGIINRQYHSFLPLCDIGVYPSFYEPWGYTAHETALFGVPTITSDLSGFGQWIKNSFISTQGIYVLERKHKDDASCIEALKSELFDTLTSNEVTLNSMRRNAHRIASECSWKNAYKNYMECYENLYKKYLSKRIMCHDTK